jgi:lipopolysaccharide/colanic/teichoic acid biosynthesis glycosyltransferase
MVRRALLETACCAVAFAAVASARAAWAPAGWPVVEPERLGPAALLLVGSSVVASAALSRRPPVDRALGAVVLSGVLAIAAVFLLRLDVNRSLLVPYLLASAPALLASAKWAPVPWDPPVDPAWPELDPARMAKRIVDLGGAFTLLVLGAPLFLLLAAMVATDGGPVFFTQERVGHRGRPFRMWKFRSMVPGAEEQLQALLPLNAVDGPAFKMPEDPRVTTVGRWLRRFSVDELPQLWNVVRGEMSLVGPRPPLPSEARTLQGDERRRFSVPQGMTGLWQVSGRADLPWDQWVALDLRYVDEWTPWLDLWLLLRTVPAVLRGTGAR